MEISPDIRILSFESSARTASVSFSRGERTVATFTVDAGLTHSEILLPMAEDLLARLKLSFDDVDAYAVVTGPGSFTGIRIGAATVKGLAFARSLPCVSVSSLEALAENLTGLCGIIVPVIDCRRNECYTALFSSDGTSVVRLSEDTQIPIAHLVPMLEKYRKNNIYLVGDAYGKAHEILSGLGVMLTETPLALRAPSAYGIGKIAYRRLLSGDIESDTTLAPVYLKPAQAERERLAALNANDK